MPFNMEVGIGTRFTEHIYSPCGIQGLLPGIAESVSIYMIERSLRHEA